MTVSAEPQQPKGFLEWCRDAAAPDEVRYTVTVLIAYLKTDDCTTAARSLATEDRLDLENYAVSYPYHTPERPANLPVLSPNPSAGTPSLSSRLMYKFVSGVPSG